MRAKILKRFSILTAVLVVLTLGLNNGVMAQKGHGNGHGGGNGHGNGRGNGNGGGNGRGNGRGGGWGGVQPGPKFERQQGGWQVQRRAPQVYQPQIRVQQPRFEIRQQKQAWKQERKQQRFEQRSWRRPQIVVQQPQTVVRQRRNGPPPWAGVWTAPGQVKKAERRVYREERRAEREYPRRSDLNNRSVRREQRAIQYPNVYSYPRRTYSEPYYEPQELYRYPETYYGTPRTEYYSDYYSQNYYVPQTRYYSPEYYPRAPIISGGEYYYPEPENNLFGDFLGGSNWTEMLLGTVLDAILGGRLNGREIFARPSYSDYDGYSPYGSYYTQERNGYYSPYGPYSGYGGTESVLFSYPSYGYNDDYVEVLTRRAYNSGYEEGFLAGQAARYNGYGEAAYNDPYFFDNSGYGYGAYSICLNRQRRLLSDGYERGYQDALDENNIYDAQNGGDVDLVSLMLNSALGMFNS